MIPSRNLGDLSKLWRDVAGLSLLQSLERMKFEKVEPVNSDCCVYWGGIGGGEVEWDEYKWKAKMARVAKNDWNANDAQETKT
jgi:hypothetical protein